MGFYDWINMAFPTFVPDTQLVFGYETPDDQGCDMEGKDVAVSYMDVSENNGFSPQIIHFYRIFSINHPFWGSPIFGNTHINKPVSMDSAFEVLLKNLFTVSVFGRDPGDEF